MLSQSDLELARASLDPSRLELILFTTEQCNFRCSYCYENFETGRMKPWVVAAVNNLISSRQKSLRSLVLSWFGGEPLAAFDIILNISKHAVSTLGAERVEGNITTNAYLLSPERARDLIGYGTRNFHVALDGYGDMHDSTRHLASGGPTFNRVWENLLALRGLDLDFDLRLRVHYSVDTYKKMDQLLHALQRDFSMDKRISVYFTSINRLGGSNDRGIWKFSEEEKKTIENELYRGLGASVGRADLKNFRGKYVCYASLANSFGVRANGDLVKCTVALYDEGNNIGSINEDGSLSIKQDAFRDWIKSSVNGDYAEAMCPARKVLWKKIPTVSI